jgi:hypothetical protein
MGIRPNELNIQILLDQVGHGAEGEPSIEVLLAT